MPTQPKPKHRTILKLHRNNNGAVMGGAATALVVGVLQIVQHMLADTALPIPHAWLPFMPYAVGAVGLVVTFVLAVGVPTYDPDEPKGRG